MFSQNSGLENIGGEGGGVSNFIKGWRLEGDNKLGDMKGAANDCKSKLEVFLKILKGPINFFTFFSYSRIIEMSIF